MNKGMQFSADTLLAYLGDASQPKSKKDIARSFGIKGEGERIFLKKTLKQLVNEGKIIRLIGATYSLPEGLPAVSVIQVTNIDIDGDVIAAPEEKHLRDIRIEVQPDKKGHVALKEQDRVLASLKKRKDGVYEAKVLKKLDDDVEAERVLGLVVQMRGGYMLEPANKKIKDQFEIPDSDLNGATDGDMAVAEIQSAHGMKRKKVKIVEVIGHADDPKAISLLSLHESGLRTEFPEEVLKATEGMKVPPLGNREDLRKVPLITIDGADARDFDDAVFAEEVEDGFHLIVAIADVSFYVRPGSALDEEAYLRGNSTYFPDRVLPMLPEGLSNDLCSIRPKEDRACLAVHMWINKHGKLLRHKFVRALMRSHARCTYEQVQAARDGMRDDVTDTIYEDVIKPLYVVFDVLVKAREQRGALDLDLPERQIMINEDGDMTGVQPRKRLDAHKLIEEFMVLANVAAAEALEAKRAPCVYRVHEPPKADRLHSAGEFIEGFGMSLPKGQNIAPGQLNKLLHQASKLDYSHLIHEVILRTQSQARYSPVNQGHYGLALERYGHFTSPIRRYADLLVHRSLVEAYGLGEGGLAAGEKASLEERAQHISDRERKSIEAERNAVDRFTASYLSEYIGAVFSGRISGVTRFGLFVALDETGADGIVPIRSLDNDFYVHDEERHALIGRRTRTIYRLGANVMVKLVEADGLTGSTVFELAPGQKGAEIEGFVEPKKFAKRDERSKGGKKSAHKRDFNPNKDKKPFKGKKSGKHKSSGKKKL